MGKRHEEKPAEEMPAPGDYELKSTIKEGPEYSIMQRRDEKIKLTVGPGEYEVIEEKGKGVTIGQKLKTKEAEEIPAPGQYEVKSKILEGPTYTMG